jgi:anti-sigma B factor antagonist
MLPHESLFSANVVHEDGSLVLALRGELDLATAPVLRRVIGELLSPHLTAVTLDLGELSFVDVVGLRALAAVKQAAAAVGAEFRLRSPSDFALRVIQVAGFIELQDDIDATNTPSRRPPNPDRRPRQSESPVVHVQ